MASNTVTTSVFAIQNLYNISIPALRLTTGDVTETNKEFRYMDNNTRLIPLTQGEHALVDSADYDWLRQWKWRAAKNKSGNCYAVRTQWVKGSKPITAWMHRLVNQTPNGYETDHIDGNGLNNTRANLRTATCSENRHNKPVRPNTSGYKGVSFHKKTGLWYGRITVDKKIISTGYFKNAIDAARAYNAAAIKYHGEFARLNVDE